MIIFDSHSTEQISFQLQTVINTKLVIRWFRFENCGFNCVYLLNRILTKYLLRNKQFCFKETLQST